MHRLELLNFDNFLISVQPFVETNNKFSVCAAWCGGCGATLEENLGKNSRTNKSDQKLQTSKHSKGVELWVLTFTNGYLINIWYFYRTREIFFYSNILLPKQERKSSFFANSDNLIFSIVRKWIIFTHLKFKIFILFRENSKQIKISSYWLVDLNE